MKIIVCVRGPLEWMESFALFNGLYIPNNDKQHWAEILMKGLRTWAVRGCSNEGGHTGSHHFPVGGLACVRCCSIDGRSCHTPHPCTKGTLPQAMKICSYHGMRLCTHDELRSGLCCGTGCDFDEQLVWTTRSILAGISKHLRFNIEHEFFSFFLEPFVSHAGDRLLIVDLTSIRRAPRETYASILSFLGADPTLMPVPQPAHVNLLKTDQFSFCAPSMSQVRALFVADFAQEVERLQVIKERFRHGIPLFPEEDFCSRLVVRLTFQELARIPWAICNIPNTATQFHSCFKSMRCEDCVSAALWKEPSDFHTCCQTRFSAEVPLWAAEHLPHNHQEVTSNVHLGGVAV